MARWHPALTILLLTLIGCAEPYRELTTQSLGGSGAQATADQPATGAITTPELPVSIVVQGDCATLGKDLTSVLAVISALPGKAKAERAAAPVTVQAAFARAFSSKGSGLSAVAEFEAKSKEARAIAEVLRVRRCAHVDVEQVLGQEQVRLDAVL